MKRFWISFDEEKTSRNSSVNHMNAEKSTSELHAKSPPLSTLPHVIPEHTLPTRF